LNEKKRRKKPKAKTEEIQARASSERQKIVKESIPFSRNHKETTGFYLRDFLLSLIQLFKEGCSAR